MTAYAPMYSHTTENACPPECGGAWYRQPEQAAHSLALFQGLTDRDISTILGHIYLYLILLLTR
ncbi:hypothetical protein DPV78_001045 [Talaromyces pinophilus]|nr:hypothetical protein DPV78_001045 [Talaromyces pinophilus]